MAAPAAVRIAVIDLGSASRKATLAFSIRCRGSATGVALGKATAAGTGENGDLVMGGEPCLGGAALAIRQEGDEALPLQVADQRAVVPSRPAMRRLSKALPTSHASSQSSISSCANRHKCSTVRRRALNP